MSRWFLLSVVTAAGVVACSKTPPPAPQKTEDPKPVTVTAASAPPPAIPTSSVTLKDVKGNADPRFNQLGLFDKLTVERDNRPAATLRAETVFDAVSGKLGLGLRERKQVAGWPVLAAYCEKADTDLSVDVVVCEYNDAKAEKQGKQIAVSTKTPRRELIASKTTWVSVTRLADSPEATAEAARISAVVKTL